jgi:transcription initiation factor TFIIIB Brf1 subunit/transcription initiation factor TFIIB
VPINECPACGSKVSENDKECQSCGLVLKWTAIGTSGYKHRK